MRPPLSLILTALAAVGFTAAGRAAEKPRLEMNDEKLPLFEVRPLDRRVYIVTLEGKWKRPPTPGVTHHVNVLFPNGQGYSHRVLDDAVFRKGEVRCVIQDYQLKCNGLADGGKLTVVVSAGRPVLSAGSAEVVSNALELSWPMDRPIVFKPPPSRYSVPEAVDPFAPAPDQPPRGPGLLPPPKPGDG